MSGKRIERVKELKVKDSEVECTTSCVTFLTQSIADTLTTPLSKTFHTERHRTYRNLTISIGSFFPLRFPFVRFDFWRFFDSGGQYKINETFRKIFAKTPSETLRNTASETLGKTLGQRLDEIPDKSFGNTLFKTDRNCRDWRSSQESRYESPQRSC